VELEANPTQLTCAHCGATFDHQGRLHKHEAACATQTPEQRHKTAQARETYRRNYSIAANGGQTAQKYVERIQAQNAARNAEHEDEVSQATLDRMAPRDRRKAQNRSSYLRRKNRKRTEAARQAKALQREMQSASILLNGKRVQITLSLDWETVRKLLIELAPDVNIDKVELIS
jgi:hypothetical protein